MHHWLTIITAANIITAFILTSRSIGTEVYGIIELNYVHIKHDNFDTGRCYLQVITNVWYASWSTLKNDLANPGHFLVITPTSWVPSADKICRNQKLISGHQLARVTVFYQLCLVPSQAPPGPYVGTRLAYHYYSLIPRLLAISNVPWNPVLMKRIF